MLLLVHRAAAHPIRVRSHPCRMLQAPEGHSHMTAGANHRTCTSACRRCCHSVSCTGEHVLPPQAWPSVVLLPLQHVQHKPACTSYMITKRMRVLCCAVLAGTCEIACPVTGQDTLQQPCSMLTCPPKASIALTMEACACTSSSGAFGCSKSHSCSFPSNVPTARRGADTLPAPKWLHLKPVLPSMVRATTASAPSSW
jgi:hypothetical protein